MREHLNRGFHPDKNGTTEITLNSEKIKGKWIEGYYVYTYGSHKIYLLQGTDVNGFEYYHVFPETVCEYTGLTDKNGIKIFEGDIVKATIKCGECYAIGEVIFEKGTFKLSVNESKNTVEYKKYTGEDIQAYSLEHNFIDRGYILEVIGNVHDNAD